ncbi:MMPL family transporter [Actinomycetes bacterium KLBMP 9797]
MTQPRGDVHSDEDVRSEEPPAGEPASGRPSLFERLAGWSYRRRWWALVAWVVVLAGVTAAAQAVGSDYRNDYSLPGTESQQALDTLNAHGDTQAGSSIQVVVQDSAGIRAADVQQRVTAMLAEVRQRPHVVNVQSPYDQPGTISRDGTIGYATVTLDAQSEDIPADDVREIIDTAQAAAGDGLRVELGGDPIRGAQESEGGGSEGAGLLAALVVLVILFGSLLAASLPIVIAIFAVGTAMGLTVLASNVAVVPDYMTPLLLLVGLGVGIDYALLVLSRFRSELIAGAERPRAVRVALDTAGRTIFFAGTTVVIALLGLVVLGLGSLQGVAVGVAVTVLVTMIAALTLLPALLALIGGRIERGVRKRVARGRADEGRRWRRWSALVQRRPWVAALVGLVALLALAAPVLGMRLGFADAGNDPESTTSRQAYDLLAQGFGPGASGPLIVIAEGGQGSSDAIRTALVNTPGIAAVTPPIPSADGAVTTLIAFPTTSPQSEQTEDLVHRLRDDVLPPLERQTGATLLVGGSTAAVIDFSQAIAGRLPLFMAVVIGLSALLLMAVFRSLLIPLKAAVFTLLSIGGSLGVLTLVFQEGWLGDLIGVEPGPIEAFVPVLVFAIAFGLSMDYEVFVVARVHEEWERTHDAPQAIREGIGNTGPVVTAAAAIMVVVFGAFLLDPGRMLKQFGLGLAIAVLLYALVIRCLLLPAVMQIFGRSAWWLPRWIGSWLPHLAIEKK